MKQGLCVGFLAAAVLAVVSVEAAERLPRGIRWQSDFKAAKRVSEEAQKPMLLVVGADWCTWCKKLERTTLSDAQLDHYINANFVPIHLDADRDSRLVQSLRAESLPTAVILSPASEQLGRITGYKDVAGYRAALVKAAARYSAPAKPESPVVEAKATEPVATKPAPYHKTYPTYPQDHRVLPMNRLTSSYHKTYPTYGP